MPRAYEVPLKKNSHLCEVTDGGVWSGWESCSGLREGSLVVCDRLGLPALGALPDSAMKTVIVTVALCFWASVTVPE